MQEIITLFKVLIPYLSTTLIRQLSHIVFAHLTMARQGTMLNISRWTSQDGTYRILKTNLTKAHYRGLKYMLETLKINSAKN